MILTSFSFTSETDICCISVILSYYLFYFNSKGGGGMVKIQRKLTKSKRDESITQREGEPCNVNH